MRIASSSGWRQWVDAGSVRLRMFIPCQALTIVYIGSRTASGMGQGKGIVRSFNQHLVGVTLIDDEIECPIKWLSGMCG